MVDPFRRSWRPWLVVLISLLIPSAAHAQAAITGVVKDVSGGVLPGATVEAASPALIEKVRSAVTDGNGQYRIIDLRPGTYSVTVALQGFNALKREGIELSGNFVATVNVDLRVGTLEETVTVTGESPVVDVQSARTQQIIDRDVLAAIPSSRNVGGIQAMIPGMTASGDSGGINGTMQGGASAIHGGRTSDSRIYADGINMGWAGGSGGGGQMPQVAAAQEVVMTLAGGLAEAETSGVVFNAVPREGSNRFTGQFNYSGSNDSLQGSNYTDALKNAGLRAPFELINVYDVSAMYGGRILRDKLWFYGVYRQVGGERTVPGMFYNKNAGNPNAWAVDFDRSQQAFNNSLERQATLRLTWQATPRNKFSGHWSEQYNDANYGPAGGTATTTPEASTRTYYIPSRQPHASWQSPITGRLLAEAGWGMYQARYRFAPRNDGSHNPAMIQQLEQAGEIPGLLSRMPRAPGQGGFTHSLIGNLASLRASLTYVTGSHSMKFGYQGGFGNPSQTYQNTTQVVQVRTLNGVPNQLMQTISVGPDTKYVRNLIPLNLYAQDQWTTGRLTLQGGVRYDSLTSTYPDQRIGGPGWPYAPEEIFFPSRSTPGYEWKDLTPRLGVAYDLFGNGKTAIRFNIGKYLEAITASNNDLDMNPIHANGRELDTRVDRRGQGLRAGLRSHEPGTERRVRAARQPEPGPAGVHAKLRPRLRRRLGHAGVQLVDGIRRAARTGAASLGDGHLQSQLVGQLVRRGQPGDQHRGLHALQHPGADRSAAPGRRRSDDQRTVQPGPGQGRPGGRTRAILQELRGSDRELAGHRRIGCGAPPERAHGAGGHEHRAQAGRRLRRAGPIAGAGLERHGTGDEQLRDGERQRPRRWSLRPFGEEPLLPDRGTVQNGLPWACVVSRPESGGAGLRDMGEHPRGLAPGGLHRDQCVDRGGAAAARATAYRGGHCLGEPDPAGHVVGRAAKQRRHARREDPPLRVDTNPGRG